MDLQPENSILSMVLGSSIVVQAVLLILIFLSLGSWTITIAKFLQFARAKRESEEFTTLFWESRDISRIQDSSNRLAASPLAQLFRIGVRELDLVAKTQRVPVGEGDLEIAERALRRTELREAHMLERGITFLATVATAAPFIGLFGTVWGIMNAFHGLSFAKSSTIQAVAPGISEALVATAIGLGAAIPASIAYNYFAVDVRKFRESMEKFTEEFLSLARVKQGK